ncbi:MAG: hypothetical protein JWN43_1326 [Gammaproteobacteria bacterium]|nr:hypothetical protein [Gammaproteobacteria bacterium]
MQAFKNAVTILCSMASVLAPLGAPLARGVGEEPWEIVPEDSLREFRGGMDLGDLVASFAIQRVVEIDGVVVARMQMVISNLDRLAKGGMPTISITGPMAQIVQFMKTTGNLSVAGNDVSIPAAAAPMPAAPVAQTGPSVPVPAPAPANAAVSPTTAGAAASTVSAAPSVAPSGNVGTVSAGGTQSGSPTQASTAVATAVAAANSANAPAPATAPANTHVQASAITPVSVQPASSAAQSNTTKTIPVGTTGQVVVLHNLPNAAALTTAVQNEVHAATIQTQTTISATLNSMQFVNAVSLANSIRAQVTGGR